MLEPTLKHAIRQEPRIDHRLFAQMSLLVKSHFELVSEIESAITDNPILERDPDDFDCVALNDYLRNSSTAPATTEHGESDYSKADLLTKRVNLWEHLERQIGEMRIRCELRDACLRIINNLNDDGYLPVAALQELAQGNDSSYELIESALRVVQTLDPAGVAARDLRECLMLQLEANGEGASAAYRILDLHFDLLVKNDFAAIARAMGISQEAVMGAHQRIRKLDPHPGLKLNADVVESAVPEVRIELKSGEYVVSAIDERMPKLRMNPVYVRLLEEKTVDSETRKYLTDRIAAASQLLWNLRARKQTIVHVCEAIVRRQRAFFDEGPHRLLPMLMIDVAADVRINPATVSRAVANKFAETPRGIIALRSLFSQAAVGSSNVSVETVRAKIKRIVDSEDPKCPLTDHHITRRLADEGIRIARRRVTTYREDLRLPNARRRRVVV